MNYQTNWQKATKSHPNFEISELGWEQHVLIDHSKNLVYRYPKHLKAQQKLEDEVSVLKTLKSVKFNVQIPIIVDHTANYSIYKYIPGQVLTDEVLNSLDKTHIEEIGQELGKFFAILHSLPISIIDQKIHKQKLSLNDYYRDRLYNSEILRQNRKIDKYLQEISKSDINVVVHGDLHGKNIVINPLDKKLVGIIDFSELEIGDPHQDFRKIFMTDSRLLEPAVRQYSKLTDLELSRSKIKAWAYINEFANLAYFNDKPHNLTYIRAYQNLKKWDLI